MNLIFGFCFIGLALLIHFLTDDDLFFCTLLIIANIYFAAVKR